MKASSVCCVLCLLALETVQVVAATYEGDLRNDDEFEGVPEDNGSRGRIQWSHREVKKESSTGLLRLFLPFLPVGGEYYLLSFAAIYGIHFLYGLDQNRRMASKWKGLLDPVLSQLAPRPGGKTHKMFQESMSRYGIFVEGTGNYTGIVLKLYCFPRWDLILTLLSLIGLGSAPTDDTMVIEIPILDDKMEPFIFVIFKKGDRHLIQKQYKAVAELTRSITYKQLSKGLECMTDCPEFLANIVDKQLLAMISKYDAAIRLIQVTDQNHFEKDASLRLNKNVVRLRVKVQTHQQMSCTAEVLKTALYLVNTATTISLGQKLKTRAWAARRKIKW